MLCEFLARLVAVLFGVQLARFVGMVFRLEMMGMRDVSVMCGPFVVAGRVRLGRRKMVPGCVFMMGGGVPVMVDLFLVGHVIFG